MTNRELQRIYYGAYSFQETGDGWLQAFQYSKEQMAYFESCIAKGIDFWYDRCMATSAKTLELTTDAGTISFEYRFIWTGSQDSFELAADGLITEIRYVRDLPGEGKLTWRLPEGKKDVVIYLPADATVLIRNCEIDGAWTPAKKNEKVLWLGDSITQGYGPADLSTKHTPITDFRTTGNANLCSHYGVLTNFRIVSNLNQVVQFGTLADVSAAHC